MGHWVSLDVVVLVELPAIVKWARRDDFGYVVALVVIEAEDRPVLTILSTGQVDDPYARVLQGNAENMVNGVADYHRPIREVVMVDEHLCICNSYNDVLNTSSIT